MHKNRDFDKNPLGDVVMKRLNMFCDRRYYVVVNFRFLNETIFLIPTKGHKLNLGHKLSLLPNFDFETSDPRCAFTFYFFYIGVSSVSFLITSRR